MVRTRRQRQEAAPQAQDYTYGWRDVPAPVQLEVCAFLDVAALGRLEACGRHFDAERAWNTKAVGLARGSLDVSTKQLVAAQGRVDALVGGPFEEFEWVPYGSPRVTFDEFAFSLTLAWWHEGGIKSASFPFMRMTNNKSEMGPHASMSTNMFLVSPEAPGQDILAPQLNRAAVEEEGWSPSAFLTCTRRTDGATIRMAHFNGVEDEYWGTGLTIGCISLENGRLLVAGWEEDDEEEESYPTSFHLRHDVATGRLLAICSTFYFENREVEGYDLYCRLHARLNDSVRN